MSPKLVLASGPLSLLLACSVYDEALLDGSAPIAGSGSGDAGMTFGGASGGDSGGNSNASTSGAPNGGGTGATAGGEVGEVGEGGGPAAASEAIIDDMEDADAQISVAAGRNGYWYVGNDGTAEGIQAPTGADFEMFELTRGERRDSTYSAHMKVSGFTGWGSVIGFNLVQQQAMVKPYDASEFCGVEFWGKAAAATPLRIRLPDGDTHPAGRVCQETGAANTLCHDHFSAAVPLTTAWKFFSVSFASLQQSGSGHHPADNEFRADQLYAMEWALPGMAGKAFEIWIDDVALLACE